MSDIILKEESYKIIGVCMEVHRQLGMGFKEIVYKDALGIEFNNQGIPFSREKQFKIEYKGVILPHKYYADFIIYDAIILEIKSSLFIVNSFVAQTINYLKASGLKPGIIVNFGEKSLSSKRVVF
jgi:GxxExxY protein